jgi:hypothetical protein
MGAQTIQNVPNIAVPSKKNVDQAVLADIACRVSKRLGRGLALPCLEVQAERGVLPCEIALNRIALNVSFMRDYNVE